MTTWTRHESIRNYEKKYLERQTLGGRAVFPIGTAYYIVDCRVSRLFEEFFYNEKQLKERTMSYGCLSPICLVPWIPNRNFRR